MKQLLLTRSIFTLTAALACAGHAAAKLGTESPFVPRGSGVVPVANAAENTPIELRGVISTGGGLRFAIYEPAKQKGEWVGLNEAGHDFTVKSFDEPQNAVRIEYQGRSQTLVLRESKFDGTAPVVAPPPPSATVAAQAAAPKPRPVAQAAAPADAKAMEAVQAEIKRRRTARTQAQPAPVAVPVPK